MNMLSNANNCIFYNCIFNSNAQCTGRDLLLLQHLRQSMPEEIVKEYYSKATTVISSLNIKQMNNKDIWTNIDTNYIRNIIESLNSEDAAGAIQMTRQMVENLEKKYC